MTKDRELEPDDQYTIGRIDDLFEMYGSTCDEAPTHAKSCWSTNEVMAIVGHTNRLVYKGTSCGAWASLILTMQAGSGLFEVIGVELGSIVEGSDRHATPVKLMFPFTRGEWRDAIHGIESEVDGIIEEEKEETAEEASKEAIDDIIQSAEVVLREWLMAAFQIGRRSL